MSSWQPLHRDIGAEVVEQRLAGRFAPLQRHSRPTSQQVGFVLGEQEHVGFDAGIAIGSQSENPDGDPGVVGGDGGHDRCAVAGLLGEVGSTLGVETSGHEDRAALGVEVEDLRGVGAEQEAMLGGPGPHLVASAAENRDVEGVDLDLEQHFG